MNNSFMFNVARLINTVHKKHAITLKKDLVAGLTTGKRSGRVYRISGSDHQASAAGEMPAKISGTLAKSVKYRLKTKQIELGETAFYAGFLEIGTGRMAARPHIKPVIEKGMNSLEKLYAKEAIK